MFRMIAAYVCAVVAYMVGYFLGALAGDIHAILTFLPTFMPIEDLWAGFASLVANIGSFFVFIKIFPRVGIKKIAAYIWITILVILTAIYTILVLQSAQGYLLSYPVACVMPIIIMYIMVGKGEYDEQKSV